MTYNEIVSRLEKLKDNYDFIVNGLLSAQFIEKYPTLVFVFNNNNFNVTDYKALWSDFDMATSRLNWLVSFANENGFIQDTGDNFVPVEMSFVSEISSTKLANYYSVKLSEMEATLNDIRNILVSSKIIKENGNG